MKARCLARRLWLCLPFTLFASLLVQEAAPQSFYVATNGDDANPGTETKPFAMLEHARDVIGKVPNPDEPI